MFCLNKLSSVITSSHQVKQNKTDKYKLNHEIQQLLFPPLSLSTLAGCLSADSVLVSNPFTFTLSPPPPLRILGVHNSALAGHHTTNPPKQSILLTDPFLSSNFWHFYVCGGLLGYPPFLTILKKSYLSLDWAFTFGSSLFFTQAESGAWQTVN